MSYQAVAPKSIEVALAHVAAGGRLVVSTMTRVTVIDRKVVSRFEKAGAWLLKEDGECYRMRNGKGSVYLFPGQLKMGT